jgi:hypothetical protein
MRSRATSLRRTRRIRRLTILLRWRRSTSIEAAMPELPDLNAPEFTPIKNRLARVYLEHKEDLGVPLADDAEIVARVDEITLLLFAASIEAGAPTTSAGRSAITGFLRSWPTCRTTCQAGRSTADAPSPLPDAFALRSSRDRGLI